MPAFHFKAISAGGKVTSGTLEATSSVAARQTLRSQGLLPLEVADAAPEKILPRPMARAAGALPRSRSGRIPLAALTLITRQMATLLGAGLRVEDALSAIAVGQPLKVAGILLTVRGSVLEGHRNRRGGRPCSSSCGRQSCARAGTFRPCRATGSNGCAPSRPVRTTNAVC